MKKTGLLILGVVLSTAIISAQNTYKADADATQIKWNGKKIVGEHYGTISLKEGWLLLDGKAIKGGEFVVDMTTIKDEDIKDEKTRGMLEGHLKSDDFFGVEKNPLSKFVITESKPAKDNTMTVKGNLTIKGQTHPVEFTTSSVESSVSIIYNAVIIIDRTLYDIRYGSGKFFSNLGDKAIDDLFTLNIKLVLKK